jgi:hypothetical protein
MTKRRKNDYQDECLSDGVEMDIGTFDTEEEAALAYDWAARILYGPDAQVNFPDKIVSALAAYLIRTSGDAAGVSPGGVGKYFDVGFKKRSSGKYRFLTCRIITPPGPFYMARQQIIIVKTKNLLGYRAIPVEGIETLYINDKKYTVVP